MTKLSANVDICPSLILRAMVRKGVVCTKSWERPLSHFCRGVGLAALGVCWTEDWPSTLASPLPTCSPGLKLLSAAWCGELSAWAGSWTDGPGRAVSCDPGPSWKQRGLQEGVTWRSLPALSFCLGWTTRNQREWVNDQCEKPLPVKQRFWRTIWRGQRLPPWAGSLFQTPLPNLESPTKFVCFCVHMISKTVC